MLGISNIFQSIGNANEQHLPTLLRVLDEHQILGADNVSVSSHITNLLSKSTTRSNGVALLNIFLKQCPIAVLDQKGVIWTNLCHKIIVQKGEKNSVSLAFDCISTIVEKSMIIPDLMKSFSSNLVMKILETLPNVELLHVPAALSCLEKCLRLYPGPCGAARSIIDKFLNSLFDTSNELIVDLSGKCLHLLQQVRGGGNQGISQKDAWQLYQNKLIGSLHELLDLTFKNCPEFVEYSTETDRLTEREFPLSDEPVERTSQIYRRLRNFITYLRICLREPFPVSKSIALHKLINLIDRGLAVNCSILEKNPIIDNVAVGAFIPEIHTNLYALLETVILTLKTNAVLYIDKILKFVLDTLKWTSAGNSHGQKKPFTNLRSVAYSILSLMSHTFKYGSCVELILDDLFQQVKLDVIPFQTTLTLKVLSGAKKHISKKERKKLHKAQNEESNLAQTHSKSVNVNVTKAAYSDEGNTFLCVAALKCLENALVVSSCFAKPTVIKDIQGSIVQLAITTFDDELVKTKLYSNNLCRKSLYDVLNTLVVSPHHLCPSPIQIAVAIFSAAQVKDSSVSVRESCCQHLSEIEKIIHPEKDCLYFAPDFNEIKSVFKNYKPSNDIIPESQTCDAEQLENDSNDDSDIDKESENEVELDENNVRGSEKNSGDVILNDEQEKNSIVGNVTNDLTVSDQEEVEQLSSDSDVEIVKPSNNTISSSDDLEMTELQEPSAKKPKYYPEKELEAESCLKSIDNESVIEIDDNTEAIDDDAKVVEIAEMFVNELNN